MVSWEMELSTAAVAVIGLILLVLGLGVGISPLIERIAMITSALALMGIGGFGFYKGLKLKEEKR